MVEPSHLAFTHSWEENGSSTPETLIVLELTEDNGETTMVFYQSGFATETARDAHQADWNSSFDKLDAYLKSTDDF